MMNVFLTSYGIDTRHIEYINGYKRIIQKLKGLKVAIIPNARLKSQNRSSAINIFNELKKNNIDSKLVDIDTEKFNIKEYDAIYFTGGEPKYLMDSIYNANLFNDIENFINNNGIIIGQSAGAMIFCKDYLDTSTGKLKILHNGFDYTNKIIVPHYNNLNKDILDNLPDNIIAINDNDNLIKLK